GLDAHGNAGQIRGAIGADSRWNEKSLTVVERDRTEQHVQSFALQRPCQAARDDVDVGRALKDIDRLDRLIANPRGGADDGGGDGAADVNVEAGIVALAIHVIEAGDAGGDAADEEAALADA